MSDQFISIRVFVPADKVGKYTDDELADIMERALKRYGAAEFADYYVYAPLTETD